MARIDALANRVRKRGGIVCFIQHAGPDGDLFEPGTPGWELLDTLHRAPSDPVISKTLNDPFFETELASTLAGFPVTRVLVTGWVWTNLITPHAVRVARAADLVCTSTVSS